jgi:hypothetical protein
MGSECVMTAGDDFKSLIPTFSSDAKGIFNVAHAVIASLPLPPPPPTFPEIPDETEDARLKRAQGMVQAGLQQVGQAAKMESEQDNRDGYAAVVKLMQAVASTSDAICQRIQAFVIQAGQPPVFPPITTDTAAIIKLLNETLQVLGGLSPAAVWAKQSSSSSSSSQG